MQLIHALALLVLTSNAAAKCCSKGKCTYLAWDGQKNRCTRWECKDGAQVSMFECCGYRKCNVFCCNCDAAGDGSGKMKIASLFSTMEPESLCPLIALRIGL